MKKLIPILLACCLGCVEEQKPRSNPHALSVPGAGTADDEGYLIVLCYDLSGSFVDLMTKDGKAWAFSVGVVDAYTRNRLDTEDEVIFAQLSGADKHGGAKPMIWQGSPKSLREDFSDADDFRKLLKMKADPNGSRLYDGIAETITYVMSLPGVSTGKKKVIFLVLSDMDDNINSAQAYPRLLQSLKGFAKVSPALGFYFVDQRFVVAWKQNLAGAGFKNFVVESEIKFNPPLPSFP